MAKKNKPTKTNEKLAENPFDLVMLQVGKDATADLEKLKKTAQELGFEDWAASRFSRNLTGATLRRMASEFLRMPYVFPTSQFGCYIVPRFKSEKVDAAIRLFTSVIDGKVTFIRVYIVNDVSTDSYRWINEQLVDAISDWAEEMMDLLLERQLAEALGLFARAYEEAKEGIEYIESIITGMPAHEKVLAGPYGDLINFVED